MTNAGSEGFLNLLPVYLDHILYPTLKVTFSHLQSYYTNCRCVYLSSYFVLQIIRFITSSSRLLNFVKQVVMVTVIGGRVTLIHQVLTPTKRWQCISVFSVLMNCCIAVYFKYCIFFLFISLPMFGTPYMFYFYWSQWYSSTGYNIQIQIIKTPEQN